MKEGNGTMPTLGVTLYSFTNEWVAGTYTLPELLDVVASAGIGPGVEIVGFQSWRGFPHVEPSAAKEFLHSLDERQLIPTCLGSNVDVALHSGRFMSEDESVEYISAQIEAARVLRFPVVRIQMGATLSVIERVTPLAERAGVVLGMEIHAPESPTSPTMMAVREGYDRIGSDRLGFIPDFSSTMHSVPPGMLDSLRQRGLPDDVALELARIWRHEGTPQQRFEEFAATATQAGVDATLLAACRLCFSMFGHAEPAEWAEIADQIVHVHGKFYEVDEDGNEPSIDYASIVSTLVQSDYSGTISSEWEAHAWQELGARAPEELIRQQHRLIEREWIAQSVQA